jgi:hypothetical protein
VLVSLLRARSLSDEASALLREFVATGSKEEAVFATRRLCGLRVERFEVLDEETLRGGERAWGRVWYWVRAEEQA